MYKDIILSLLYCYTKSYTVSVPHQGGPGHLYLLKNKVATFAKVEKEDDMIQ